MDGMLDVNGVSLWRRISGDGEPVVQIHGAGFGHFNFDPATPVQALSKAFLETPDGVAAIDAIQQILGDANSIEVFTEKQVIRGSNHSTIFDNTVEHNRVVIDFFTRHGRDG